jgi:hypothetical protein
MNNKKTRTVLIALASILAVILAVGIVILSMLLTKEQPGTKPTVPAGDTHPTNITTATESISQETQTGTEHLPTVDETTIPTTAAPDDVKIETPYAILYYPGEWADFLEVQTEGDTYTFFANVSAEKQQKLFSLTFGGITTDAIGILRDETGKIVPLHVQSYQFTPDDTWTDRESNIVFTMMDLLNEVLTRLPLEPVPEETVPPTTEPVAGQREAMGIDTAYCQLMYPAEWGQYMNLDAKQDSVGFYCVNADGQQILLFTIYFGTEQGTAIKTIADYQGNPVEVRLDIQELVFDSSWSEADQQIARAMQEDVNFLLDRLS